MPGLTLRRQVSAGLASLVAASALLACSPSEHAATSRSSATPTTAPTKSAAPAPRPVAPIGLVVDRWLDTASARPRRGDASSRARAIKIPRISSGFHTVLAIAPGGRLLAERGTRSKEGLIGTAHVGWLTHSAFEPLDYADTLGTPHQITAGSTDGRQVVWVETTSTDLFHDDWRIYTAAVGTAGRTLVADSGSLYGKKMLRPAFGQTMPILLGSKVYWSAVPPGRDPEDTRVLYDDLNGSAARPRVIKGALPASNGRRLFVVRQHLADPSKGQVRIVSRTSADAESIVQRFRLAAGQAVTALAASRTHVAWVVSESDLSSKLFVEDLSTHSVTGIVMHHFGADTMALGVGRNRVVWGNGSDNPPADAGEYVFRPRTGALVRLGQLEGHSVARAYDRWITWTPQAGQRGSHISTYMVSH